MPKNLKNYAFIDGANLYRGVESQGWSLDYKRFRVFLRDKYAVGTAYWFIGYVPEQADLYRALQSRGFTLVFKPTIPDPGGRIKGNCDAELVLQAMIDFDDYDKAVIVTSDGDFHCLVRHLEKKGKLEAVVSPKRENCSILLKRAAPQKMLFLDRFRSRLEYKRRSG